MKANRPANLRPGTLAALALAALLPVACAQTGASTDTGSPRLEILDDEWQLAGFENSLDLSGIAAASKTHVLVGSDEMFHVQPGVVDFAKQRIESKRPIALPIESTGKKQEVDIEGVAFSPDDNAYYVVGSHGLGKKKGDFQPDRHSIYQVPVDPATGVVKRDGIRRASLLPWLEKTPRVEPHLKQPLQQNGLNIEGLTWSGGKLWFGLRAPNQDGRGLVLELAPGQLFDGGKPAPMKVHEIAISKGRGIREIAAVKDGFIVLTGNASAEASKKIPVTAAPGPDTRFELLHWNGRDSNARNLGRLPENGGKGEALLVLDDTDSHIEMLVIFDGLPGGEPMSVRIHR
ncbi:DUF3616 domain-containing protein [Luteolibacter flavescens]|uniref:DUF3616 domain-containing protein n=1 Tax=Luteolibacter flavescens TaxID=1859460 RepID=A0ABT3FQ33_9BACT|nr:DUF3616 domain-containing protein [Luteolibacter flavescens]MCW1885100.1 DUF3616 domain-containing protein [Luteolibacter flavescens]